MSNKKNNLSKFISLILRHKPEAIGITLDEHGYANVDELIEGINKQNYIIDFDKLKDIVDTDNKQRYSFNKDFTKIRANQGHSIKVDVELEEKRPPKYLYHGTATRFVESIHNEGIKPQSRLYVHLSDNHTTATKVGTRHGSPEVLVVEARNMYKDGYKFYLSKNGVWLTEYVPTQYII